MKGDLLINNVDAFEIWGVRMGDNFLDVLGAPAPMKEFIENKSRLEHGKSVIYANPRLDEREVTLNFTLEGNSSDDFQVRKKLFFKELYKGKIDIQIPQNGGDVYHLTYLGKSATYAQDTERSFCKLSAKFNERNPANRSVD